ncbi:glycosyltransferase family 39 protein [Dictyobacter arantiisoli]|uniref:Glycosyltransferase RgtA/B/C/D-like domain-containing protein n=1 Tax=Dictyobacter arantiisoli TaxID=2014874 RepID=A0A5A5T7M5_9CHLR|nr:glycosyltransferase family 39 protein [Dictyobacter arantiisoli]GCF07388.1 hypothetical protein KDI_09520 [Dictyobacter arantiisoli]
MSVTSSNSEEMILSPHKKLQIQARQRVKHRLSRFVMWLCLFFACAGTSWFAIQYFLIPQQQTYIPQWTNALWIQPVDIASPVAYYRYNTNFDALPDNAYIMLTANQVFRVYVNGISIGTNGTEFVRGEAPRAYIYDIDSVLRHGNNAIGIRVVDVDKQQPQLRASIGVNWGTVSRSLGSNASWQATGQTILAHPRGTLTPYAWTLPTFDTTQWQSAQITPPVTSGAPLLTVNPAVYSYPMPGHWLGSNGSQDGYFVCQVNLPTQTQQALLRLVATGTADVFINDHEFMQWNGQAPVPNLDVATFLDDTGDAVPYRNGLLTGVYDVTPYLHTGNNVIAIHVQSPGTSTAKVGLDNLKSAMSMDLLASHGSSVTNLMADDKNWHVSNQATPRWTQGNNTATWMLPIAVQRPGASKTYYLPDNTTPRNIQIIPPMLITEMVVYSCAAVLALWLFTALFILRRLVANRNSTLEAASLIFLPALTMETLLIVLDRESLLQQPFPYTSFWALLLITVVICSIGILWLQTRRTHQQMEHRNEPGDTYPGEGGQIGIAADRETESRLFLWIEPHLPHAWLKQNWSRRLLLWLCQNWGIIPIIALAIPMACYNIGYEPFWQDELSSYNAARNVMMHGFPAFPSGFVYPKGELYSYLLAGLMFIFGTSGQVVPRLISTAEYLISIPLLYIVAGKLFKRKIAWLATAMLAFSPYALIWSRQTRMYEQAQFMVIIVVYTLYRAIQLRERKGPVYLALLCMVLAYFSHEENFIILPAALVCALLYTREGRYGIPSILRKKHWWVPALIACTLIISQLLVVFWSHPPTFATDQSRQPQIEPGFDNLPYYIGILFQIRTLKDGIAPWNLTQPWLIINSLLTVSGCILAFLRKDRRARYCASFLLIASATLIMIFTMQADRYYYPLLPIYYMLGAYAFWSVLDLIWRFARPHLSSNQRGSYARPPLLIRIVLVSMVAILGVNVLIFPALPLSNYNLFISRALGLSYRHHFADYDNVGLYMQRHLKNGDVIVTVAPAVSIQYYVGHVDYYFSIDRALFLIENNKKVIETTSGAHPLLNQQEFQNVLAAHNRIWLITDNGGYQAGATKNRRFTFPPPDFRMVYEGYGSAIYFRSGNG